MPPNIPTFGSSRAPLVDKAGNPSRDYLKKMQEWDQKLASLTSAVNRIGQLSSNLVIQGRTEGIGTTVGNLTATGQLNNFTNVAAGRTTDNLTDGTGSPLTGGKRGFLALDVNNRLADSSRANALNVSNTPTSSTVLSNTGGAATLISVAASTAQFGNGTISYNSGSVNPGIQGSFFVFADDPTFAGGAVTYQFSATASSQTAADGRVNFGKITTSAVASTGGGSSGGTTPGGGGGRGFIQG